MEKFSTYEEVDLQKLNLDEKQSISKNFKVRNCIQQLNQIKIIVDKAAKIEYEIELPQILQQELNAIKSRFLEHLNDIIEQININMHSQAYFQQLETACNKIENFHRQFFEIAPSSNNFQFVVNSIMNFELPIQNPRILNDLTQELKNEISKSHELSSELKEEITHAKTMNSELQEKVAKAVVSNYADIFSQQEEADMKSSKTWLTVAVILSLLIAVFIPLSLSQDWFNISYTGVINGQESQLINYPNLITKIFFVSFLLYIVSFCYKQYSIKKHLQTLNNHRKNALNSYNFFANSIGSEDTASRNALMLQVAKTIYEHSNSGYLSTKQAEGSTSSIVEFTKFISDQKQ